MSLLGSVKYKVGLFGDMERYAGMPALLAYEEEAVAALKVVRAHLDRVRKAKELRIDQGDSWPACITNEPEESL